MTVARRNPTPPGAWHVRIDRARCQGHARCVALAPEIFEADALGNGRAIGDGVWHRRWSADCASPRPIVPSTPSQSRRAEIMAERPPVADWASDFDPLDPDWVADPYPLWREMRERWPVAHTERFMGVYFASRYEDVRDIAYDSEHFSSRRLFVREHYMEPIPAPPITSDPPAHRRESGSESLLSHSGSVSRIIGLAPIDRAVIAAAAARS